MKFFTKFLFLLLVLMISTSNGFTQTKFFSTVLEKDLPKPVDVVKNIKNVSVVRLNESALRNYLKSAPMEFKNNGVTLPLEIPLPDGTMETFQMVESPILSPAVAALYPEIKTYAGYSAQGTVVRLSLTSSGFNAILLNEGQAVYFQQYAQNIADVYFSYFSADAVTPEGYPKFRCGVESGEEVMKEHDHAHAHAHEKNMTGATLRTLRIAMAGTGEFTANYGGDAMNGFNAIVGYVNRMSAVFRTELSVSFTLVSTSSIVYTNPATDPYTNGNDPVVIDQNQINIDNVIGSANYDVAHVLGANPAGTSPGGLAALGAVCNNSIKATGVTSEADPNTYSLLFNDQVLQHEIGHMFGMTHSYNSNVSICTSRNWPTSVEPGSGATIMSYGFTCDIDDYFPSTQIGPLLQYHTASYDQAVAYLNTVNCYVSTATGNLPPVVTMPSAHTIPKSTPFSLTGSADSPGSGDTYTYCWEGTNLGIESPLPDATTLMDPSKPPFFRTFPPSTSPTRIFPLLSAILDGSNIARGDKLPSIGIATTHRLTVRDNNPAGGGVTHGEVIITVDGNIGPFLETTNLSGSIPGGSSQTITWSVNGTNVATPNINILLSIDGGQTFPITLAANTPNDGSQMVTIPSIPTMTARIKVEAVGNIFFDISNSNFTISISNCAAAGSNICPTNAMTFNQGDPGLNLGLSSHYGTTITQHDFNLSAGSPTGELANATSQNGTSCQTNWQTEKYEVLDFTVSATGSYAFNDLTNSISYAVFLSTGYNPAIPCAGTFIGSNSWGSIQWSQSRTLSLTQCTNYKLVVWTVNDNFGTKTISISGPGSIFTNNATPNNTGYTYVAVNQANNQIAAVSATSNFTTLTAGVYKIYGASYKNGGATPPANSDPASWVGQTLAAIQSSQCVVFSLNNKSVTINAVACTPPTVTAPTVTQPTCATPTGTIVVNATGGPGSLEYSVDNGASWQTSSTFSGLNPGSYNIKVRLQNDPSCMTTYTQNPVVLNTPTGCCTPPTVTAPTVTQPTCATPTGTIVVNATGGPGSLEYSVDNGASWQTSSTFSGLNPGSYNIKVRLQNDPNCMTAYAQNPVVLNPSTGGNEQTWYKDLDNDGFTDGATQTGCDRPAGYKTLAELNNPYVTDCDDNDPLEFPGQTWYRDADNDNYSNGTVTNSCLRPAGYKAAVELTQTTGDCNDNVATTHPNAPELCNGVDDDCDGQTDEGISGFTYNGNVSFTSQAQLNAWPSCYSVINGNVTINGTGVNNLGPLSNVTQITGNFIIQNTGITSMSGLTGLTNVGGNLSIYFNSFLTTLNGLDNLAAVGGALNLYYNFKLSACCAIYNLINGGVGGPVIIFYNKVGCNSVAQINSICNPNPLIGQPNSSIAQADVMSIEKANGIDIFPNPAGNTVNVRFERTSSTAILKVVDIFGRVVFEKTLGENVYQEIIDLNNGRFGNGIYLVSLLEEGEMVTRQLVVQH